MKSGLRVVGLFITVVGLSLSTGCTAPSSDTSTSRSTANQEDIGEVLAEVNADKIGTKDFDLVYNRTMPRRSPSGEDNDAERKKMVMDRLVADKLLYQEALRQNLDKEPKIQRMVINTLLRKDVYSTLKNADISDEELHAYFDEHKDDFIIPEKVQVKRILIKAEGGDDAAAKAKADDIHARLTEKPDDFRDIAIKESQDSYARRGGEIGFISRNGKPGLDSAVVEEAFKLEPNTLSEVFKSKEGYNIIQVVNKRDRVERSFDQMKGAVLRKLKTEKSREIQTKYVEDLKANAKIVVHDDKVQAYTPAKRTPPAMMPGMKRRMPMPGKGTKAKH